MADIAGSGSEPVGTGGGSDGILDPAALDNGGGSIPAEPVARKRKPRSDAGKPRSAGRTGTAKAETKVAVDLSSITGMFVGLHGLLAVQTGTPEIAISEDEGKQFMTAAQNVMRHYSVQTTQKTLDWIALVGMASGMYVPRVVAINQRKKASKVQRQRPQQEAPQPVAGYPAIVPDMHGTGGFTQAAE